MGTRPQSAGVAWPLVCRSVVTGATNLPSFRRKSEPLGYRPLPQAWTLSLTGGSNILKDGLSRASKAGRGRKREAKGPLGPGEKAEGCPTLLSLSVGRLAEVNLVSSQDVPTCGGMARDHFGHLHLSPPRSTLKEERGHTSTPGLSTLWVLPLAGRTQVP